MSNQRTVKEVLTDVVALMDRFSFVENEDCPYNSFFNAELNEDEFFSLRLEIVKMMEAGE